MVESKKAVTWRPAARADVESIFGYYIETAGVHTAIKLLRKIEDASCVLQEHPLAGVERSAVRPNLRSLAVDLHVIFYQATNNSVEIVRVLDGRQDVDFQL